MDENSYCCMGRLGADPELKYAQSGKAMATFNLAINAGKDETLWLRVKCWEKTAERAKESLKKGSKCYIRGALKPNEWTDSDGNLQKRIELNCSLLIFMDPKSQEASQQGQRQGPQGQQRQGQQQGRPGQQQRPQQQRQQQNPPQNQGWGNDTGDEFFDEQEAFEIPF